MKRILIVEDEVPLLNVYSMLFTANKFTVYGASNGKVALKQLAEADPDIIVLDVLMPVMGGIEFLQAAKIKKKYPKTKILVLSNLSDPQTIEKIEKFEVDKYLLKASLSPSELLSTVNQLLA